MKGFAACVMAVAPQLAQAELARPIYLCFSYDEEVGCLGCTCDCEVSWATAYAARVSDHRRTFDDEADHRAERQDRMRAHVTGMAGHSSFAPRACQRH